MRLIKHFSGKSFTISLLATAFFLSISLSSVSQVISNPTVLNSMTISDLTATSATLSWMYRSDEFDSAPGYIIYSKTSSETFFNSIASVALGSFVYSQTPRSQSLNVTNLQPNTTYIWFLNVLDEAKGMSEPLVTNNYNNTVFLGYSILTTSTYQFITFTTPNTNGTGGSQGVLTTISGSTIPVNQLPVANAGTDITVASPANSTTLSGLGSTDADGGIQSVTWSKVAGPSGATLNSMDQYSLTPTISNLVSGTYTYRLVVYDSRGGFAVDFVDVVVNGGGVNQLPSAFAGIDKVFTLPQNSTTANITLSGSGADGDGFITDYLWTKLSGPASFTINTPTLTTTTVNNLVEGTYVFQLTVTDNRGGTANDLVNITFNGNGGSTTGVCNNDNFESNNTSANAASISIGSPIQAKLCPLTDVDFFRFTTRNARTNVRVTLSNIPSNYLLELFGPNGNLVGVSNTANAPTKVIVFNSTTVGTYRIKVSAGAGATLTGNSYSLLAETNRNSFAVPGGSASTARVAGNLEESVVLKDVEVDSYQKFDVYPNPASAIINIIAPANEAFKSISIFNQSGQVVKVITPQKNLTSVNISALEQGIYIVKAVSVSGIISTKKIVVVR
ncbi:MAG: T9SS type A sorting domain-containing protein [Chitinophagaceae bacterium]|nr:T9SS type A sorting domain-containing protein [Chitinophagaceae bacterium]